MSGPPKPSGNLETSPTSIFPGELRSPLLASPRSIPAAQADPAQTKRFQQDDQIEILDYSEDATNQALYGMALDEGDASTTLTPKVPNLTSVIRNIHAIPGNIHLNEIYGQNVKIAKLSTSDSLNSYPKHHDHAYSSLQTSPTTFTDPQTGVSVPIQSHTAHQLQSPQTSQYQSSYSPSPSQPQHLQNSLSTLTPHGNVYLNSPQTRSLSSLDFHSPSLLSAVAAQPQAQSSKMGSINVTQDGTYLLDQGLGDAIVDNLYSELSTSLGLEFVQYMQNAATIPIASTDDKNAPNENEFGPNFGTNGAIIEEADEETANPFINQSNTASDESDSDSSSNPTPFSLASLNAPSPVSRLHSLPPSTTADPAAQQLLQSDDQVQVLPSQRIRVKSSKLVNKKRQLQFGAQPIDLNRKSIISPETVYNAHNPEIDNLIQQQYASEAIKSSTNAPPTQTPSSSTNYAQPTFEPLPAPVGASITQTKDASSVLFINNVEEPLSKTTYEQISFLGGFWPQIARFVVCGILGIAMACITHVVQWIVGHLVTFLHWTLTVILQQEGGVIGYSAWTVWLWPFLAMLLGTIIVIIYWVPGVALVYWAGIFAVKGSGLPALNAYFDGSYDQNVPLFGTNVLLAKLISVTLSLGGLLKGGLQGPLIHVGAMVARMTLRTTLKILNTNIAHRLAVYLCCCCFDRRGHARKLHLPCSKSGRAKKQLSYIQSQNEKDHEGESGNGDNDDSYKPQVDSADYYAGDNVEGESWVDVDKELAEQQIQRYSPPRLGLDTDVESEMQNRINIYAHSVNIQHSNIVSYRENEESRLRYLKRQRELVQLGSRNETPATSPTAASTPSTTSPTSTTATTPDPQLPPQQYQFHHASRIATAAQSPAAKGNDFDTVQSLTLSSRIELIVRSLSGPQDEHDALACGATSGFTCAFNAPLAGMVMIQAMLKQQQSFQLTLRMFFTALVSVLTSNLLSAGSTLPDRGFVDLDIPPIHPMPASELYLCIALGLLGGLLGVLIIKFNVFLTKYRVKWYHDKFVPNIQLTILLAMIMIVPGVLMAVGTTCTPITEESFPLCRDHPIRCMQLACPAGQFSQLGSLFFGTPDRLLRLVWDRSNDPGNEFNPIILCFFFFIYIGLASTSFLGAFPGGFFIPGILIGGMFGRLGARFINYWFSPYYNLQLGVYATLGSVSMLASVNRVTLPPVAMMVEFTSDVQFLTPIMIVVLSAKFIADFFCLGLEPEVGRLQPRVTMALGEANNPAMGHANAKDVLSINSMLQGYPSFCLNDEMYPGHSDLAIIGEIDSVHRIQALLETTTHSSFPVVSVLPSNITSCTHISGLAERVYQRSILKSLQPDDKRGSLGPRSMSSLPSSASLLSSLSTLGQNRTSTSPDALPSLQVLQPYHDDIFAACPCQSSQHGHGKFIGLITRRSLRMIVERSVDYTRATRIINSGNHQRLFRGGSSTQLPGMSEGQTQTGPTSEPGQVNLEGEANVQQHSEASKSWFQRLTSKFNKNVNTTDAPGTVDSVTAQIDANRRVEQLDLVDESGKKAKKGVDPSHTSDPITCHCLTCTTHRWALVRYHTPVLALLQHQMSKKRIFPILANIYFQTGLALKRLYKQPTALPQIFSSLPEQIQKQLSTAQLQSHFISLCHPVLVHRELLSTTINFISSLIKLPKLPQHLHDTIFRLAQMKSDSIEDESDSSHVAGFAAHARRRQITPAATSVSAPAATAAAAAAAPAPSNDIPVAQLVAETNSDAFDADLFIIPSFIRFVTWLEERSAIRYSLNQEHITKHKDQTNDFNFSLNGNAAANAHAEVQSQGLSASSLCVSLVNTLPLVDTGVYVSAHTTSGARLWRLFRTAGMAKIVIVNDNHEPIGIITRKDIVRADRYLTAQMNGFRAKLKK